MLKTLSAAFVTWLVPLLLSFGLYTPETKIYFPNYTGFKLIMAAVVAIVAFATMRWLARKQALSDKTPPLYIGVNSALDLILLVMTLAMPFAFWVTTILPIYVLVFYVAYFVVKPLHKNT
jgi:hypothetical protein